ncbi:MAG: hypothetical protein WBL95_07335 [Microcoleus sp.]
MGKKRKTNSVAQCVAFDSKTVQLQPDPKICDLISIAVFKEVRYWRQLAIHRRKRKHLCPMPYALCPMPMSTSRNLRKLYISM